MLFLTGNGYLIRGPMQTKLRIAAFNTVKVERALKMLEAQEVQSKGETIEKLRHPAAVEENE